MARPEFRQMEAFSKAFLSDNRGALARYARRWVRDPLHQWSRQWEYPYVFEKLRALTPANARGERRILDAGSGLTFFPSFVVDQIAGASVCCCDYDAASASDFGSLAQASRNRIQFHTGTLQDLPYADASFEAVYCISVLEHTAEYDRILQQFERVLAPGGVLVITFDVSLDGRSEVDPAGARRILASLDAHFTPIEAPTASEFDAALQGTDLLTTGYTRRTHPDLMPWQRTWRSDLATLARLRIPRNQFYDLAVCCGVWAKPAA